MSSIVMLWNALVASTVVIAVVLTALGLMVGTIKPDRAFRRLGIVIGYLVLLLVLPPIIASIWRSLSLLQHLGIITLAGLAGSVALRSGKSRSKIRVREH